MRFGFRAFDLPYSLQRGQNVVHRLFGRFAPAPAFGSFLGDALPPFGFVSRDCPGTYRQQPELGRPGGEVGFPFGELRSRFGCYGVGVGIPQMRVSRPALVGEVEVRSVPGLVGVDEVLLAGDFLRAGVLLPDGKGGHRG